MSNFQSYKTITERLKSLGEKLAEEKLSAAELDEFENLARQLYERALILNYKAKEVQVHGDNNQSESEEKEKVITEKKESDFNAVKEEKAAIIEEKDSSDAGEIQFDFTTDNDESDEIDTSKAPVEEKEVKEDVRGNREAQAEPEHKDEENKINTEKDSNATVNDSVNQSFENEKERSFYEQFEKVHRDSLGDRLGASKLNSLKGAIGLNDRLQFIAELFNGESDAFNKAINALDEQPSNESARKVLSQVATKHSWDEENPLVEEFARIIERRYVEE